MTPVLPCSTSNSCLIPGTAFSIKKNNSLKNGSLSRKSTKCASSSQRLVLPLPGFVKLFPQYHRDCAMVHRSVASTVSATGTDVAVEKPDSPVVDKDSGGVTEIPAADAVETIDSSTKAGSSPAPAQSSRSKGSRKSEMPPVKNEDLVPGATFTGKVRSIQPFGAFVDFGAFTDGLVHVSKLSDSFVKDVGSVVSVGQEVKVRLVEANTETGRISLTMRENDDMSKFQQRNDSPATGSSNRQAARRTSKPNQRKEEVKSSKFVKGQNLEGTVKNLTRSGAFISLPEGEEGFLPRSEESDDVFAGMMGDSSLQIGQEVSVRVLRITRGQVTLTMKKEDADKLDTELIQGIVHTATNPFVLAFRKNKDIAAFLDEREIATEQPEKPIPSVQIGEQNQTEPLPNIAEVQDQPVSSDEVSSSIPSMVDESVEGDETSLKEVVVGANVASDEKQPETVESSVDSTVQTVEKEAEVTGYKEPESIESSTPQNVDDTVQTLEKKAVADDDKEPESMESSTSQNVDDTVQALEKEAEANDKEPESIESSLSQSVDDSIAGSDKVESIENSDASGDTSEAQIISSESRTSEEVVENQVKSIEDEMQIQTPAAETEITSASQLEDKKVEPAPEINGTVGASNGQSGSLSPKESVTTATISPVLVKQLREDTGAGMMDCKKALSETGGDIVKAQEFLRKKGLASAEKKASRATAEGRIGSYIHDSRIGVLVEANCETDFVSRGDIFKELVDDLAMQVAACPQVQYLVTEDVPEDILNKEKEIEMQKEDLLSKPEQIRSKIVEGRIRKRLEELALLEQPYIKNDKVVVKDWVKQTIATIGENIKVKRFVRYNLGEGLEKKSQDFAAEVAAQTTAKPAEPAKELPAEAEAEAKETAQKPPAVVVSAALVKQLREETGAGMMDCKKALSETGGDLEKAQEYLRKKGLSAADKKSSRLAAEGRIGSYIHDSRIGVLIEVNCETDFVGRSEKFKELVDDLAMQVVACPQVQFVSVEDIPENIRNKEKELEMQRDDLMSKPENIREKIVEGRISKRFGELALLEQPFIKNDSVLVKDLVKQTVAALGENIKVRRFVRFTLGESTEDTETGAQA